MKRAKPQHICMCNGDAVPNFGGERERRNNVNIIPKLIQMRLFAPNKMLTKN